jgi:hypothetical protein
MRKPLFGTKNSMMQHRVVSNPMSCYHGDLTALILRNHTHATFMHCMHGCTRPGKN